MNLLYSLISILSGTASLQILILKRNFEIIHASQSHPEQLYKIGLQKVYEMKEVFLIISCDEARESQHNGEGGFFSFPTTFSECNRRRREEVKSQPACQPLGRFDCQQRFLFFFSFFWSGRKTTGGAYL